MVFFESAVLPITKHLTRGIVKRPFKSVSGSKLAIKVKGNRISLSNGRGRKPLRFKLPRTMPMGNIVQAELDFCVSREAGTLVIGDIYCQHSHKQKKTALDRCPKPFHYLLYSVFYIKRYLSILLLR